MIDNIDLDILKFMSDRSNYETYNDVIHKGLCTKESWTLVQDYGKYFEEYPNATQIDTDFDLWFRVQGHPGWKPEQHQIYGTILSNVQQRTPPQSDIFIDQLERLRFQSIAESAIQELAQGTANPSDVVARLGKVQTNPASSVVPACSFTLDDLAQHQRSSDGLYWRLEDLNKSVGPIRKGDFIIVGKRPEVGGTSFICSEMSYMCEQLGNGNAILFNNEEAPDKVFTRMVSGALGVDYRTMMKAHKLHQQQYETWLNGKEWDLVHNTSMDIGSIHRTLQGKEYSLIGINVLLKVGGTGAKEDHDKFQALGEEMRRISQEHGPVLAVVQADPSAEGMRYIPQDRIYKSKTALQGEADVLLMIGSDDENGPPDSRYIHVAKNKIPPAACCDLAVKHIKSEVSFDMGTGRFESKNYQGNSRSKK
jgi:replicative DNA helicase